MVVLSGDQPNSVNVRFRVSLYSLSSVGCQISVFNKLSTVSSWNGYLRFVGWLCLLFAELVIYLSCGCIHLLVIEGLEVASCLRHWSVCKKCKKLSYLYIREVYSQKVCYVLGVTCVIGKCRGGDTLYTLFGYVIT
ncbi:hypothetical protein C2G38_2148932 [Gigaspora rosea]|uniref:Uncharacterized protein n=1 Tax=Gigaspora rosea TaxID=44941 RepID=A0A397U6E1_9GLOM|nr:hypothetical protein C2G38_2148932 [Gigaspora rosea]